MSLTKVRQLYEGKAKKVYETEDKNFYIVSYKDDATAFNGEKKGTIEGKGAINNRVTNFLMQMLEKEGIPTDFVEELNDRETVVKAVKIVPLEVIVRNIAAGSLSKRLGIEEGVKLEAISKYAFKVNDILREFLKKDNIDLIDFKLEFGRLADGTIVLADEISPDTCRFWDSLTGEKLDKDRFRRDMGGVEEAYKEVIKRLMGDKA